MSRANKKFKLELTSQEEIKNHSISQNTIVSFVPHHPCTLNNVGKINGISLPNEQFVTLKCSCLDKKQKLSYKSLSEFYLQQLKNDKTCTIWLNPSQMPILCFLHCILEWKRISESLKEPTILGILLPEKTKVSGQNNLGVWNIDGYSIDKKKLGNVIWYVSLSRAMQEIKEAVNNLEIREIFPVTEVECESGIGRYSGIIRHKDFLNEYKVRTEKIIYIDKNNPSETFEYLINSVESLPKRPSTTIPIITPGGIPVNYIAMALSAVISDSYILLGNEETFSENLTNECLILESEC